MNPEGYNGPFDKDTIETKSPSINPLLTEGDFIQEGQPLGLRSLPIWLWIVLATMVISLIWGSMNWYQGVMQQEKKAEPFLDVTNREFSVFLWQFPSFLRANALKKTAYLPGFQTTKETLVLNEADNFVSAPPDLLFLYHTWNRLLASESNLRPINPKEFSDFLNQVEEWQPKFWKKAPKEYVQLIDNKEYEQTQNLQTLSVSQLPVLVRQAFQGWKNYYQEGPQINALAPTIAQVQAFLESHPHYKRNFWRNIQQVAGQEVVRSDYLFLLTQAGFNPEEAFPTDQLAPFLKVAMFNAAQVNKDKIKLADPNPLSLNITAQ
ncbi:hypothetical protein [Candidatus Protochlamydia sp. R18]|uniref:hypothetical protein n=1 Tax=Candidatus Protochlamydia sp. R18 TaxID=1353977 RepID=UPI000693DA69|nr:hypothetical protein [Candidatus Protochlamydia sp. R18]